MKKIFTMAMLSILSVLNLSAAEAVLWEGDYNVSWELPDGDQHKEWKELGQADFANLDLDQNVYFYLTIDATAGYHQYSFDTWSWSSLPGQTKEDITSDTKVTLVMTQEMKQTIANDGFAIHGHGFHVVKVTKEVADETPIPDLDPIVLWMGEVTIDGWGANSLVLTKESEGFNIFAEKLTTACNLYFLIDNASAGDFRIAGQWGEWGETSYPAGDYNHLQAIDADNVVKVSLTNEFVAKAFVEKGGIAFWGNGGFVIKAIATTKDAIIKTTAISLNRKESAISNNCYNLAGQRMAKPGKGLNIINGKKFIIR